MAEANPSPASLPSHPILPTPVPCFPQGQAPSYPYRANEVPEVVKGDPRALPSGGRTLPRAGSWDVPLGVEGD